MKLSPPDADVCSNDIANIWYGGDEIRVFLVVYYGKLTYYLNTKYAMKYFMTKAAFDRLSGHNPATDESMGAAWNRTRLLSPLWP
jgi:hypothetical protein